MANIQNSLIFHLCSQCRGRGEFLFYSYLTRNSASLEVIACPCVTLSNDIRRAQFEYDELSRAASAMIESNIAHGAQNLLDGIGIFPQEMILAAGGELRIANEKLEALKDQYCKLIHGGE